MASIPLLKVVIAGDGNVGKTSLVRQYCEGRFENSRVMTIGVDFQTKMVELPGGPVKLSIWDMAGQGRFQPVRAGFYRGSLVTALVYDLTLPETLKNLSNWFLEIKKILPNQKFIVVGNKADLAEENSTWVGKEFARIIRAPYLKTSACTGEGVAALFEALAHFAYAQPAPSTPPPGAQSA